VENNIDDPVLVIAIFYLKLPSGYVFPVARPLIGKVPGGIQISEDASVPIPANAPEGIFRLFVLIVNPDNLEEDVIEFEVTS